MRDALDRRPRWFLDPLDGTANFVHKLPAFPVSMGCTPGARNARVSRTEVLRDSILATGFPYRRNELEHNNLANFNRFFLDVRGIRRFGSAALDLAYVAAGRFDGYWELYLSPHDVAAGALLVREAGGLVTDCDGGDEWLRAGHVVAANAALHERIRARIVH